MTKEYHQYLLSPEWKEFRKKAFDHYGRKCSRCARTKNLQVHHLHYDNIFNEKLEDVQILCKPHHEATHGIKEKNTQKRKNKLSKSQRRKEKRKKKKIGHIIQALKPQKSKHHKTSKPIKTHFPTIDKILERKQMREVMRMRVVE